MFPLAYLSISAKLKRWNRSRRSSPSSLTINPRSMNNVLRRGLSAFAIASRHSRPRLTKYHSARAATAVRFPAFRARIRLSLIRLSSLCVWLRRLRLHSRTPLSLASTARLLSGRRFGAPPLTGAGRTTAATATIVIPPLVTVELQGSPRLPIASSSASFSGRRPPERSNGVEYSALRYLYFPDVPRGSTYRWRMPPPTLGAIAEHIRRHRGNGDARQDPWYRGRLRNELHELAGGSLLHVVLYTTQGYLLLLRHRIQHVHQLIQLLVHHRQLKAEKFRTNAHSTHEFPFERKLRFLPRDENNGRKFLNFPNINRAFNEIIYDILNN